ncbi:MAG: PilZ domain-containing protein [Pseudomonadales bacterium]|nr:PilZ domain-containing protein [Pseudomonadales bacterium]
MSDDDDRRVGVRHIRQEVVHVEIVSTSHDRLDMGEVISCATVDVSSTGLQITMDHRLPEGAILDLCVELKGIPKQFFLTAEVRWNQTVNEGVRVGFKIFDGEQTDIDTWTGLFI